MHNFFITDLYAFVAYLPHVFSAAAAAAAAVVVIVVVVVVVAAAVADNVEDVRAL